MQILRGRRSAVGHLAISADSRYVAAGGLTELHVWDLHDPDAEPTRLAGFSRALQFVSDGRLFSSNGAGWGLHDPAGGRTVRWERTPEYYSWEAASPCGRFVLQPEDGGLCCWRLGEDSLGLQRELAWSLPGGTLCGGAVFAPDAKSFALFCVTVTLNWAAWVVHRLSDGGRVAQLETRHRLGFLKFTPDGGKLLSAAQSCVYEWKARVGGAARLAVRHPTGRHFRSLAVHPGGATLAGITGDNAVSLFDLVGGGLLRTYDWRVGRLKHTAFTPDGTRCAVAGSSGKVLLFDVD